MTRIGSPFRAAVLAIATGLILAACSTPGGSTGPSADASAPASTVASAAPSGAMTGTTIQVADSPLGMILTDGDGNTVYLFSPDSANTSTCAAGCIDTWPPVSVEEGGEPIAGDGVSATISTMTRDDGTIQVTVNELPIYHFGGDTAAGQTNGQGVGGKWFVVGADGGMNQGEAAAASTASYGRDGY